VSPSLRVIQPIDDLDAGFTYTSHPVASVASLVFWSSVDAAVVVIVAKIKRLPRMDG
jgi:hypothetical protein